MNTYEELLNDAVDRARGVEPEGSGMIIVRKSPLTGMLNTRVINVTQAQLSTWRAGVVAIQDVMPDLSASEREFIMSGYTDEDWDAINPEDVS